MNYKILLIEDDRQIQEIIKDSFEEKSNHTMNITIAGDGSHGLELALYEDFDLIILDIMLPHMDGFSVMRSLREKKDVPVIFLTARNREEDILHGYQLGCDDYITKPFSTTTFFAKAIRR